MFGMWSFRRRVTIRAVMERFVMLMHLSSQQTEWLTKLKHLNGQVLPVCGIQIFHIVRGVTSASYVIWHGNHYSMRQQRFHHKFWSVAKFLRWVRKHVIMSPVYVCLFVCLFRNLRDTGDGHRCRWSHIRQQRPNCLQHPSRPALLLRGSQDRWAKKNSHYVKLFHHHLRYNCRIIHTVVLTEMGPFYEPTAAFTPHWRT